MGARPEDYERSAPYHSYIHVDDFEGPKQLAEYLHKLDQDDNLYQQYFQWKVRKGSTCDVPKYSLFMKEHDREPGSSFCFLLFLRALIARWFRGK